MMTTNTYAIESMVRAHQRELEAGIREQRLCGRLRSAVRVRNDERGMRKKPGPGGFSAPWKLRLLFADMLIRTGNRIKEHAASGKAAA